MSVFAGGFTMEAAEAVGPGGGIQTCDVLGLVSQLADKSLILVGDDAKGRFRILETIRQYAAHRLADVGEEDRIQRCHFEFFRAAAAPPLGGKRGHPPGTGARRL
jgi:predicted ATPase